MKKESGLLDYVKDAFSGFRKQTKQDFNDLANSIIRIEKEEKKQKEDKVLELINGMLDRCEPITYKQFNQYMKAKDTEELRKLEMSNPEVGLINYSTEDKGISTLSIIATITEVLTGKRLAFVGDTKEFKEIGDSVLTGVCWFKSNSIEKDKRNVS